MEWKIGEIRQVNGKWYQCLESNSCRCGYCDYDELGDCDKIACTSGERSDNKEVYFKKLEKVGEPYKFQKRTIQTYKLYIEPFISVDMDFIWAYVKGSNTIDIIIKQDKEDMEENKLNLKPFDIQKAKAGKPVCTRDGCKARIICFDSTLKNYPLVVLIEGDTGEYPYIYTAEGKFDEDYRESNFDLMMLPEKKEGWMNIYSNGDNHRVGSPIYNSKEEALNNKASNAIDTVKIEWRE